MDSVRFMPTTNSGMDAYIVKSADFAKPILNHLRQLVHRTCPDIVEVLKWGFPHFDYRGMFCSMASFKGHCTFGFWKANLVFAKFKPPGAKPEDAMGQFGRITSSKDLPPDQLMIRYLREAMRLNEAGIKRLATPQPKVPKELIIPAELLAALKKNKRARAGFDKFSHSHQKEYLEWIAEAKRDETRQRRIAQAMVWLAQGKSRNWKYC